MRRVALLLSLGAMLAPRLAGAQDVARGPTGSALEQLLEESAGGLTLPGLTGADSSAPTRTGAQRFDAGRFTVVAYPRDFALARSILSAAQERDTFPGLPRPEAAVLIAIAPDAGTFRQWIGPAAPEWGAAVAFPALQRVILQGSRAGSDAGNPLVVLRHELAHLALHEALGDLPPRWFDEGYASVAAGEWGREEALATSLSLVIRGVPTLDELEQLFYRGAGDAQAAYALAHRAVTDLSALDPARGLTLFFRYWKETRAFEPAVRQAYGITALGFEQRWQSQTRRRYGALALLSNLSLAFGIFAVIIGPFVVMRRRRDKARMAALRRADVLQEEAAARSALEAMLAAEAAEPPEPPEPSLDSVSGRG